MEKLMLGNEAVARGLYEAGVKVVSSYPGTPSTEVTEEAVKYNEIYCEWAPNEKVAMETAFGASLAGARSCCCMKHVGMNVAADPMFTISYTGVNGGMMILVADDPAMHSSQNEQDSRHYAEAAKIPMLEPSDSREAKEMTKLAYELSEKFDTPVILRTCTRIAHAQCAVSMEERKEVGLKEYVKTPEKYIMSPANAIRRHPFVEERTEKLRRYAETSELNRIEEGTEKDFGIICAGTCYEYVKEVFGNRVPVLKLGMAWPLPVEKIKTFAGTVGRLIVIEELDPVIENHVKALGISCEGKSLFPILGEFSQNLIARTLGVPTPEHIEAPKLPMRPPVMCAGCPHRGLFYVLAKNKLNVIADIGCYTLGSAKPLNAIDMVLCMGASVSGTHGFNKARGAESEKKTVAVIGDSTFMHSGMTGLANIAYNGSNSTVIIVDNSITGMTGHQNNPANGLNIKGEPATRIDLEALCHALGIRRVKVVDPYDLSETEKVIMEEVKAEEPSVIISRRPCALLKTVKHNSPLHVNTELCVGCQSCLGIGCPAIHMNDSQAEIDYTQCTGCGVCQTLCPVSAIGGEE